MRRWLWLLFPLALPPLLLHSLPEHPFWYDEVFTANLSTFHNDPADVVRQVAQGDAHPPLFYLLAWAWAKATGLWGVAVDAPPPPGTEERARAMGVYLSLALTAPLSALSPPAFLLLWSSEPWLGKVFEWRMYGLLGGLWLLALLSLARRSPWGLGLTALFALYTHYLSLLYVGLLYLAVPLLWPKEAYWGRRGWPLLLPLLFLPWVPVLWESLQGGRSGAHLRPGPVLALDPLYLLGGERVGYLVLATHLLGVWAWTWRGERRKVLLSLLPLLAVLLWWGASLGVNITSPRYFGAFLPPLALGWAWGVEGLLRGAPKPLALGLRAFPWALALPLGLKLLLPWGWLVPDENFGGKALRAEAMEARWGSGLVVGDEGGRLVSLRYYWRGETRLVHVRNVDPHRLPEAPWYGLLLYSPMMPLKAGEQMGELASALKGRGCRMASFENEDPRLLFYRCGKGSARGEGGGSILPAVGRGDAPPASSEVDR